MLTKGFITQLCVALLTTMAFAQGTPAPPQAATEGQDVNQLAKQTQNPVGDIISLPFQFNFNSGGGLADETYFNLNFQPVIPIHLSSSVTAIARTIVPINSFPGPSGTRFSGLGDIQEQLFFTPARPGKFIWG